MNAAARTHTNEPAAIRIGRTWLFADGTRLPVIAGADDDQPVVVPEDLTALAPAELEALETAIVDEFDSLHDSGSTDVAALTDLAEGLERVRSERGRRDEQAAADAAAIAALAERVHAAAGEDDGDDDGDDPGEGAPAGDDAPDGATADEPVAVTAAAPARPAAPRAPSAAGTARRAGRPRVTTTAPRISITAAADLPGVTTGATIDLAQVATSMHDKARALSNHSARVPIARFNLPQTRVINERTSAEDAWAMVEEASNPQSLVAAGGWCTPSENSYDLLALDSASDLLDLPSIGISRGGINTPSYIGIDAADGALWDWTEDQDELTALTITDLDVASNVATATTSVPHLLEVGDLVSINVNTLADGPRVVASVGSATTFTFAAPEAPNATNATGTATRQKSCFTIPCPTWTETRLTAYGLCITHGNLTDKSFPELGRRYVSLAMNAHLHRMSTINIAKIRTSGNSDAVTVSAAGTDSYGELMSAIGLQATDFRSQYKISDSVVLEVLLPTWTKEVLRANLAMRAGVDMRAVSDAQIVAELAVRKVKPQFLADYQPLWSGAAKTAWPTSVEFLIYVAGGFVEGTGGVIDLGVQRDSVLNKTNDFTLAWTEEFRLMVRKGPKARKVSVTLSTDGVTACCA